MLLLLHGLADQLTFQPVFLVLLPPSFLQQSIVMSLLLTSNVELCLDLLHGLFLGLLLKHLQQLSVGPELHLSYSLFLCPCLLFIPGNALSLLELVHQQLRLLFMELVVAVQSLLES